jgi:outer membrane lipoprotein-sorting protein
MITGADPKARRLAALIAAGAAGLFAAAASAADWSVEQLMRELAQVKSAKARFVERREMAILSTPLESSGTLVYTAPDRLEKHTLEPRLESLVLVGERLTLESRTRNQRRTFFLQDQPAIRSFVESIRATLAGDLATLNRYYDVGLHGGPDRWRLLLKPTERDMRNLVSEIHISGSGDWIDTIEIVETVGDRSVMTITRDAP